MRALSLSLQSLPWPQTSCQVVALAWEEEGEEEELHHHKVTIPVTGSLTPTGLPEPAASNATNLLYYSK